MTTYRYNLDFTMDTFKNIKNVLDEMSDIEHYSTGFNEFEHLKFVNTPKYFEQKHIFLGPKDENLFEKRGGMIFFLSRMLNKLPDQNITNIEDFEMSSKGIHLPWIEYTEKIGKEVIRENGGSILSQEHFFSEPELITKYQKSTNGKVVSFGRRKVRDMERLIQIHLLPNNEIAKDFAKRDDRSHWLDNSKEYLRRNYVDEDKVPQMFRR